METRIEKVCADINGYNKGAAFKKSGSFVIE